MAISVEFRNGLQTIPIQIWRIDSANCTISCRFVVPISEYPAYIEFADAIDSIRFEWKSIIYKFSNSSERWLGANCLFVHSTFWRFMSVERAEKVCLQFGVFVVRNSYKSIYTRDARCETRDPWLDTIARQTIPLIYFEKFSDSLPFNSTLLCGHFSIGCSLLFY